MANQEHIQWLLNGVSSWNAARSSEGFVPDLEGANLISADLFNANLRGAKL